MRRALVLLLVCAACPAPAPPRTPLPPHGPVDPDEPEPPEPPPPPKSMLTCEDALDWAFTVLIAVPPLSLRPQAQVSSYYQDQLAACERDHWPDDQLDCLRAARDRAALARCGVDPTPTCEDAAERRIQLVMRQPEVHGAPPASQEQAMVLLEKQRPAAVQRCRDERWSRSHLRCAVDAGSLDELEACGDMTGAFDPG